MFCLNSLPSVGETETCDIECWGLRQPLSESSCFLHTRCPEIVWWKLTFIHSSSTNSMSRLWLTLYHVQSMAPTSTTWKPIANLCLNCYFKACSTLLKNPLKWLAEEMIQLLKAPNFMRHVLLELSTLCRWKETCDIECWGLRQRLCQYWFFFTQQGPRNCLVKTDSFRSLVRIHCQASDWHCITFNWRPRHDKLKTYCKSVP